MHSMFVALTHLLLDGTRRECGLHLPLHRFTRRLAGGNAPGCRPVRRAGRPRVAIVTTNAGGSWCDGEADTPSVGSYFVISAPPPEDRSACVFSQYSVTFDTQVS